MPILNIIFNLINGLSFFVCSELIAILISLYTVLILYKKRTHSLPFLYNTKHLLIIIIISSILEDLAWLINIISPGLSFNLTLLIIRLAWIFAIIQYQAFNFFIENLIPNQSKFLILINRLTSLISIFYSTFFIWLILFKSNILKRQALELIVINSITNIYMPIMIAIYLFFTLITFKDRTIPNHLRTVLYFFTLGLIVPTMLVDAIYIYLPTILYSYFIKTYNITAILALFIAISAFCCIKQILKKPLAKDEL